MKKILLKKVYVNEPKGGGSPYWKVLDENENTYYISSKSPHIGALAKEGHYAKVDYGDPFNGKIYLRNLELLSKAETPQPEPGGAEIGNIRNVAAMIVSSFVSKVAKENDDVIEYGDLWYKLYRHLEGRVFKKEEKKEVKDELSEIYDEEIPF